MGGQRKAAPIHLYQHIIKHINKEDGQAIHGQQHQDPQPDHLRPMQDHLEGLEESVPHMMKLPNHLTFKAKT